jgi:hypothetical protein
VNCCTVMKQKSLLIFRTITLFTTSTIHKVNENGQVGEDEIGRVCRTMVRRGMDIAYWKESKKDRNYY